MEQACYEICFTRLFCKPQPQRPREEIRVDRRAMGGRRRSCWCEMLSREHGAANRPWPKKTYGQTALACTKISAGSTKREIDDHEKEFEPLPDARAV